MNLPLARPSRRALALAVASLPLLAAAHTGADAVAQHGGFLAGLMHPLAGPDHLAAMLAVGCWSALTARQVWLAPLAFACMLLLGASAGLAGLALPAVEPMIVASLLVLGLLVATRQALPAAAAAALVAGFALFHGIAHGHELAGAAAPWTPLAGMTLATLALHLAGIALGRRLRRAGNGPVRVAGGTVVLLGLTLLLPLVRA